LKKTNPVIWLKSNDTVVYKANCFDLYEACKTGGFCAMKNFDVFSAIFAKIMKLKRNACCLKQWGKRKSVLPNRTILSGFGSDFNYVRI
jgi:hypothetical protein